MRKTALAIGVVGVIGASTYTAIPKDPFIIQFSPGGSIQGFYEEYSVVRASGRQVRIDGMCLSACTMVAGLIPRERVCVTPFAVLGFHSAYSISMMGPEHSSEGTRLIWQTYPTKLKDMLTKRGWNGDPPDHRENPTENKHPEMIYIRAPDLYSIFRPCS